VLGSALPQHVEQRLRLGALTLQTHTCLQSRCLGSFSPGRTKFTAVGEFGEFVGENRMVYEVILAACFARLNNKGAVLAFAKRESRSAHTEESLRAASRPHRSTPQSRSTTPGGSRETSCKIDSRYAARGVEAA
jgi:hypothetical protein